EPQAESVRRRNRHGGRPDVRPPRAGHDDGARDRTSGVLRYGGQQAVLLFRRRRWLPHQRGGLHARL
ncbi:MAG: hypothetical protein AVDCRST_MAG89-1156, partial [uncultured Gemmatimonadetes bacterium]